MYLGYQDGKIKLYTATMPDKNFVKLDQVMYTEDEYVLDGDVYVIKDSAWEQKQVEQQKQERNSEIDNKIQELQIMAIPEILNGNLENIKIYNDVIAGLENARP